MILDVLIFLFVFVIKFFLSFFCFFFFLFEVFSGLAFLDCFELWFVFDFDFHDERCLVHLFLVLYVYGFE